MDAQSTGLDPARIAHHKKTVIASRKAREKRKQEEHDQAAAIRLASAEQRKADYSAGHEARLALLAEFGDAVLVFGPEYALAECFAFTVYRRWVQAAIGPGLALNAPNVLQDQIAFSDAFAELFKLEVIGSVASMNKGSNLYIGPGDTSPRFQGVAVTKLRDRDAEYKHWKHLRHELGVNAPADPSDVNLGGLDLSPANEQPDSELIPSRQRGVLQG